MPQQHFQKFLGPCPSKKMLMYWGSCIAICAASWQCYLLHPVIGIIFIGLAPFVNLFLFFKGVNYTIRTFLYFKTYKKAKKSMLKPNWGHAQGGFILVDKKKQLWVANGILGKFTDLSSITTTTDKQAYYLQLNRTNAKPLNVGMNTIEEATQAANYFQNLIINND